MINTRIKRTNYCGGKGVFSNKDFKKDETIFVFKGKKVGWRKSTNNSIQIGHNQWIVPTQKSNGNFLNHSCSPSCGIKYSIKIVAIKHIKKGKEITIDYSITVGEKFWKMKCNCNQKNCRKIIKSYKEIPKKLKEKYKGWESEYLRR